MKIGSAIIRCDKFCEEEKPLVCLTRQLNQIKRLNIRKIRAEDVLNVVNRLLDCPDFKNNRSSCYNCRLLSRMRRKTALFIIGQSN